jgi:phosphoribosylformylglycinamidine synthase PurS subunit
MYSVNSPVMRDSAAAVGKIQDVIPGRNQELSVARVVVDVMLKPEILDPQGKAVHGAFGRLGFDGVADVRQGKRFEITLDGEATEEKVAEIRKAADTLLANPVIEDYTLHVESDVK